MDRLFAIHACIALCVHEFLLHSLTGATKMTDFYDRHYGKRQTITELHGYVAGRKHAEGLTLSPPQRKKSLIINRQQDKPQTAIVLRFEKHNICIQNRAEWEYKVAENGDYTQVE